MSNEKDVKRNEASLEGNDKPMERRSFLKAIGLAGGAALAHFFVLGKPSTAFGGVRDGIVEPPIEALPIPIRSRCRPVSASFGAGQGDKGDACYVKDGRREVGDRCFIRRTSTGHVERGDQCVVVDGWAEVGDQCQIRKDRQGNEVEVGDQCGGWTGDGAAPGDDTGDQCFISHQSGKEVEGSDLCIGPNQGSIDELGDQCRLICRAGAPPEEVGDQCLFVAGATPPEVGDQCWPDPAGANKDIGDECNLPDDPTVDVVIQPPA